MFHIMFILRCKLKLCNDIEFGEKHLCIKVFKHELTSRLLASVKFLTNSQIHVFSTFNLLDKTFFLLKNVLSYIHLQIIHDLCSTNENMYFYLSYIPILNCIVKFILIQLFIEKVINNPTKTISYCKRNRHACLY